MYGDKCKFDNDFICISREKCSYNNLLSCLKVHIGNLFRELDYYEKRKTKIHNETTLKWRGKSFYYKDRCRKLEMLCKNMGIDYKAVIGGK